MNFVTFFFFFFNLQIFKHKQINLIIKEFSSSALFSNSCISLNWIKHLLQEVEELKKKKIEMEGKKKRHETFNDKLENRFSITFCLFLSAPLRFESHNQYKRIGWSMNFVFDAWEFKLIERVWTSEYRPIHLIQIMFLSKRNAFSIYNYILFSYCLYSVAIFKSHSSLVCSVFSLLIFELQIRWASNILLLIVF